MIIDRGIQPKKMSQISVKALIALSILFLATSVVVTHLLQPNQVQGKEEKQERNYFGSLYDIYRSAPANKFTTFNEKYFLRLNNEMKEAEFQFYAQREPLIVVYVDMQVYFYDRSIDFERYGFDPVKVYNRTYTLDAYHIMKTFAHSSLYLYYKFAVRLIHQYTTMRGQYETSENDDQRKKHHDIADMLKNVKVKLWGSNSMVDNELIHDVSQFMQELNDMESDMQNTMNQLCGQFRDTRESEHRDLIRSIVQMNREFISGLFRPESELTFDTLNHFARKSMPTLMKTTELSVRSTLAHLNFLIDRWRQDRHISDEEYSRTRVLIIAGASPRKHCMQSQFFMHALNQTHMGDRVIYAENMYQAKQALNRLKTVYNDLTVGQSFFNDKFRMQQDLLADTVKELLNKKDLNLTQDFLDMIKQCPFLSRQRRYLSFL